MVGHNSGYRWCDLFGLGRKSRTSTISILPGPWRVNRSRSSSGKLFLGALVRNEYLASTDDENIVVVLRLVFLEQFGLAANNSTGFFCADDNGHIFWGHGLFGRIFLETPPARREKRNLYANFLDRCFGWCILVQVVKRRAVEFDQNHFGSGGGRSNLELNTVNCSAN